MKMLKRLAFGVGLLASVLLAPGTAQAGIILDTGHYHGIYGAPFITSVVGSAKANSVDSSKPVLFVYFSSSGLTVPHVLTGSLSGHTLTDYSAVWFGEGFSSAVTGFEAALASYAASGRWVGFEAMYFGGYTAPLAPMLGFDPASFFNSFGFYGCADGGATTPAGLAFGLTPVPDTVSCRVHETFSPTAFPAGWVSFHDMDPTHSTIMATGAVVPEPGSLALLALGLLFFMGGALRRYS